MTLEDYIRQLQEQTRAAAQVDCCSPLEAFTRAGIERLVDDGHIDEATVAYYRKPGVEIAGWGWDPDRRILHTFVTEWSGETPPPSLPRGAAATSVKRLRAFIERCADGYADRLEKSNEEVWEAADFIRRERVAMAEIRLYLLTDRVASDRPARAKGRPRPLDEPLIGVPTSVHIWDSERFYRLESSGVEREPIGVDLADFGAPHGVPVLEGPASEGHRVYMAILPGQLVADLYEVYGARLLERNVRSFLQARGAVNRGIRDSLLYEPDRFLAYNNGLSATASDVSLIRTVDGGLVLNGVKDLQIVNGGQTTASLHNARVRARADLSEVAVAAKLTVIEPETVEEMVPYISRYSNTQNKVTVADISANNPFHVAIEKLSRTVWAPSAEGSQQHTQWFYERARGQYADELARAGTPAKQRQFKLTVPISQKFTKTDLAKYCNTWDQRPETVSLGAEKNFTQFMSELEKRPIAPDIAWFQHFIALAILFRSAEKIVQAQAFGGYRSQIVTYTLARISRGTARRLDLDAIWRRQALDPALRETIAELSHDVQRIITNPPGRIRNISEWAKKRDCWGAVSELPWQPSRALERLLGDGPAESAAGGAALLGGVDVLSPDEIRTIDAVVAVGASGWLALSAWAKETSNLQPWQRSIAYSVGALLRRGGRPSIKQAIQCDRMLFQARELGFGS